MKLEAFQRNVEASGVQENTQFSIEMNAAAVDILSSKIYTNNYLAIVRELSCNAWDAHVSIGTENKPFEVWFPNMLKSEFRVRDYGPGLAHEDIMTLYTTYFGSDKRNTNSVIGGFGLGSKSPLAYTDQFTTRSYHGGVVRTYAIFKDDQGLPNCSLVDAQPSSEPNGLEVSVPVQANDHYKFTNEASALLWFPTVPTMHGAEIEPVEWMVHVDRGGFVKASDSYESRVVMGNVIYKVSARQAIENSPKEYSKLMGSLLRERTFVLHADIGELAMAASREELNYTKATLARLYELVYEAAEQLKQHVEDELETEQRLAYRFYKAQQLPTELRRMIKINDVVPFPTSDKNIPLLAGRVVDRVSWRHKTSLKTAPISRGGVTLSNGKHPIILCIDGAKNTPYRQILRDNEELRPADTRSYRADIDVFVLELNPYAEDNLTWLDPRIQEYFKHFDKEFLSFSSTYWTPPPKQPRVKGAPRVAAARKRRMMYTHSVLHSLKIRNDQWDVLEDSYENMDKKKYVLVGFNSNQAWDWDRNERYSEAFCDLLRLWPDPNIKFLAIPRAGWATAKKQGFRDVHEYFRERLAIAKRSFNPREYVFRLMRSELDSNSDYNLLRSCIRNSSIWEQYAPDSFMHQLVQTYAPVMCEYHAAGLTEKDHTLKHFLGRTPLSQKRIKKEYRRICKELDGALNWLRYQYPEYAKDMGYTRYERASPMLGHYINLKEGITE